MEIRKIIISGFAGSIVYFLAGWLFYGILFKDIYPDNGNGNLFFIYLGGLVYNLFVAYVLVKWSKDSSILSGMQTAAFIGFVMSLSMNFFIYADKPLIIKSFILDICISIIIFAILGIVIAFINSKLEKK
ncbi:MAG: hypothetical protein NTZ33_02015 [Bacteroidetes bacterium]|nr:hypothetical protein [Bacteroidota bacterium]